MFTLERHTPHGVQAPATHSEAAWRRKLQGKARNFPDFLRGTEFLTKKIHVWRQFLQAKGAGSPARSTIGRA